jgi:hypothetical protein
VGGRGRRKVTRLGRAGRGKSGRLWAPLLLLAITAGVLTAPAFQGEARASGVSVSDDFGRADGGLGPDWTTVPGTAAPQVSGGAAVAGTPGTLNSAYWSADSFSPGQYAQASLPASSGSSFGPGIAVRLSGATGYVLWYGNEPGTVSIWRMDSSWSWTQLAQSATLAVSPSDVWRIEADGPVISAYQDGTLVAQATDGAHGSGSPGIWLYYSYNVIANWSGGDLAADSSGGSGSGGSGSGGSGSGPTAHQVGGTAAGLSGPVVLADNGGDDLTVPADGAFRFPAPVAAGAPYSVTVATEPAGQTCTVAGGSGTVGAGDVASVVVACAANATVAASDDFSRAGGGLGSDWTDMSDGGLTLSAGAVAGTSAAGVSGDIRTAEGYPSDQYSQVTLGPAALAGDEWIGPSVRMQADGSSGYVGAYSWRDGDPAVIVYRREGTTLIQAGAAYDSGPLPAGASLKLEAVGDTLALLVNGVERVAVADATLVGGAPGIMAQGAAQAGGWAGGTAGFEAHYLSTDSGGVATYDVISARDGSGPQPLRVLQPAHPAPGVAHNFLFVLPVEAGQGAVFGDGMQTLEAADAQDRYNLTIIEPSFAIQPWYADNPLNPHEQEETFLTSELAPWARAALATTGTEQNWLIGFSKSGIGGQDLIFKHPDVFALAASWDFPADMSAYDEWGGDPADSYGTDASFQAGYRLTPAFLAARRAPFEASSRIWIGGYAAFGADGADYDALLTAEGIAHTTQPPLFMDHRWDSGWVPVALAALYDDSLSLPRP